MVRRYSRRVDFESARETARSNQKSARTHAAADGQARSGRPGYRIPTADTSSNLPDPHDRHFLAAAGRGGASVIVTNNTKDSPAEALEEFEVEAQTPDEFVHHLIDLYPDEVLEAANTRRASLRNPPKTLQEYLITLERQGLPPIDDFLPSLRS